MLSFSKLSSLLLLIACTLLSACEDDNGGVTSGPDPTSPTINVRLTDEPGDYERVIIDVRDVQVRFDGDWIDLDTDYAGSYDLLELTAGVDTLLATSAVPAGNLEEVRLILGEDNFIKIEGEDELIPLRTPSAQQSGLKIKLNDATLAPNSAYVLLLDFDAGRSIVRAGNSGNYNLKPVIRAELQPVDFTGGAIVGLLTPAQRTYVFAYQAGGDTLGTFANQLGVFRFVSVPAGIYTVEVGEPTAAPTDRTVVPDVTVSDGNVSDLGAIDLN
jgi:hypothetical protein